MKTMKKEGHPHQCSICKVQYKHHPQEACTEPEETVICGVCKKELEAK